MFEFDEELKKYKPISTVDDVESAIESDELLDIMDLLRNVILKADKE